uniref:prephenate dehydratase n=1 Tax=Fulvivirga sp. TaxID=1931237 RepID=UPI00404ABE5C
MELNDLRKKIDAIDAKILELLNERMEVVNQVGELKRQTKAAIYRPEREKAIIDRLFKLNKGRLNKAAIEAIFLEIFAVARNIELPERIAYLGPEGSFTHQAAESRYGAMSFYTPLNSIKAVFESVKTDRARFGVIPIENNQEGVVQETIDLLGQYDLNIVAELPMAIHFAFATEEEDIKKITKIYSKDIAFKQCRSFIDDHFDKNISLVPVNSTSTAVKMAKEEKGAAAICAHIAAREYNLPILFENIEDSGENFTRFIILGKGFYNEPSGADKTSIIARLADEPGALATFLQEFHNSSINLCKVESRPAKEGSKFKYIFFIDFEGHYNDTKVQEVIKNYWQNLKWLGSYVRMV